MTSVPDEYRRPSPRTRAALLALGLILVAPAHAAAQDAGVAAPDPIATQINADPSAEKAAPAAGAAPGAVEPPHFSPGTIADILKREHTANPPSPSAPAVTTPAKAAPTRPPSADVVNATGFSRINPSSRAIDPVVLKAEILLDRAHAPPGVIDGRYGANFVKAIRTFQEVRGLEVNGILSREVWNELGGDKAAPVLGTYTITAEDVAGPFYPDLSPDYAEQAKLPDLGYRSAEEMFGERFHMDRRFLRAMNPDVDMNVPGNTIIVAQVETLPIAARIARIDVDKGQGQVLAYDADNMLVVAYPATIGSDELPSPSGSYVVRGVAPHPTYTYDPKKNFQQGNNTQKLILPPGPNNPVGAAFIALSKPTYGIHGTPDPSKIDKTRSHGCVRLTNWNAQELAKLVTVGTPVNFIDKPGGPTPDPDIATLLGAAGAH